MLDVYLLGHARICNGGEEIRVAKRNVTIPMLAYLLLHRDRAVAREFLAYTLFPDAGEEDALAELRRYLYRLQNALPKESVPWIVADSETVRWNPDAIAHVDVIEFERAVSSGALTNAVELYGGDLLAEVYDDWVFPERERLRSAYGNALTSLVVQARRDREYGTAIAYAQRLLAYDPWREDIVRHLLAARYELGDAAGALAEYDRFDRSIRAELHTYPMNETQALRDVIASGAPLPSSLDRRRAPRRTPMPDSLPLSGRDKELERIRHAWERALRGNGCVVAIEGEPGIGKSRLAAEFAIGAESEGARVIAGATSFPERVPYQCLLDALRAASPLIAALPSNPLRTSILARVLPELLAQDPSVPEAPEIDPQRDQLRLFDAIGATLCALARTRPMLIVLEDLHWAGRGTLMALHALARRAAGAAMLIVVTFRDEEAPPEHPLRALLRDLGDERLATRIALGRLSQGDVREILQHVSRANGALLSAEDLYSHSEGNPLFLGEAIRDALEGSAAPAGDETTTVIARRVARLSPDARALANAAAVCGSAFDGDVVCDAAGMRGSLALAAMDELLDRHIVREASTAGTFDYAFTHHLVATALYDALSEDERVHRHARVGRALERAYSNRPDDVAAEIARHYAAGHDGAKASEWYMRAARAARLVFAYDDVVRFVTFALDAVDNSETTFELLLMREEACARLGRREEQYADLERLDELMAGDVRRCEIARRRIEVLHASDDRDAERRAIGKLRVHAEAMNDRRWQGVADGAEAWLEISVGAYERAESFARRAIANLETGGSAVERVEAFCALAEIQIALGNETAALDALELAQAVAQEASDDRVLARALMQVVAAAVARQQFDCAIQVGERVAALYRSQGDLIGEATAIVSVAAASLRMSRWAAARDANVRAARTFELAGDRRGLARVYMNLGMLHGRCADFEEGRAYFARARVLQERLGDERARTAAFLNESFLALWQQRPDEAKALAMQALACAMHMNHASFRAAALANLGAAERDLGELDAALAHVEEGLAAQLELGRLPDAVSDLADAALTHAIRGNMKIARMHVDRILDLEHAWASAAFPPFPPWVAARVLHAAGDPRAFDVLASASKLASTFSASIDVPELRTCFDGLPFIVELKSVCGGGAWPPFRTQLRHGGGTASW